MQGEVTVVGEIAFGVARRLATTRRKVNLNSYHRNRNDYCAADNYWAEILCCNYSAFATVLA